MCHQLAADAPEVEIISVADNFLAAVSTINEREPDLVFLDLDLPRDTSVNLLEAAEFNNFVPICFGLPTGPEAVRLRQQELPFVSMPLEEGGIATALEQAANWRGQTGPDHRITAMVDVLDPVMSFRAKLRCLHSLASHYIALTKSCAAKANATTPAFISLMARASWSVKP